MRNDIALPPDEIRRLLEQNATLLILGRRLRVRRDGRPSLFELHNARIQRRNARCRRDGTPGLLEDPRVCTVEVIDVEQTTLEQVTLTQCIAAGYRTTREMLEAWERRRGKAYRGLTVHVHRFKFVEARYLAEQLDVGYVADPGKSARDEPEAVGELEQQQMSIVAQVRDDERRRSMHGLMTLTERLALLDDRATNGDRLALEALRGIRFEMDRAGRGGKRDKETLTDRIVAKLERAEERQAVTA